MAYFNLPATEGVKMPEVKPVEQKEVNVKDYLPDVQNLRASENAIRNTSDYAKAFHQEFPDFKGLSPTGVPYIDVPYGQIQRFMNWTPKQKEAYTNYKNSLENELIPTILRNEGIPLTGETLQHARESYNLDNMSPRQLEALTNRAHKRVREDNVFLSNQYKKPNIAGIGSDREYAEDEIAYMQQLKGTADKMQQNMPTFQKVMTNNGEGSNTQNSKIMQDDVNQIIAQSGGDINSAAGPIYEKITGEPLENATQEGVAKYIITFQKSIDENTNASIFAVMGAALGLIKNPVVIGLGALSAAAVTGGTRAASTYIEGGSVVESLKAGAKEAAEVGGDVLSGALAVRTGESLGAAASSGVKNIGRRLTGKNTGVNSVTELAASSKLQNSGRVSGEIREASEKVLEKYSAVPESTILEDLRGIAKDSPESTSVVNQIEKEFKIRGKNSENAAEAIYKTLRDSSSGDTVEKIAEGAKLSVGAVRNILKRIEKKILPDMVPLSEQAGFLTKIKNSQGKNIQPKDLAAEVDKLKLTDNQKVELLPEIFGASVDNETFDILRANAGGDAKGAIKSVIDAVSKGVGRLVKGKKVTYQDAHMKKAAERFKEVVNELKISTKNLSDKNKAVLHRYN